MPFLYQDQPNRVGRDRLEILTALIAGPKAKVEIKHDGSANALGWTIFEYRPGDAFPLTAVGPLHADQQVGPIRLGRNMVGGPLKVDVDTFKISKTVTIAMKDEDVRRAKEIMNYPWFIKKKDWQSRVGFYGPFEVDVTAGANGQLHPVEAQ